MIRFCVPATPRFFAACAETQYSQEFAPETATAICSRIWALRLPPPRALPNLSAQTDVVERVGGQPPQSLEHFIRGHLQEFNAGPVLSQQA